MRKVMAAVSALLLAGCAVGPPRIQTGPDAVRTPDGLHMVDGVNVGKLFMKPDYHFGSYHSFILGPTEVTYSQQLRMLDPSESGQLTKIFEAVARQAIAGTGRTLVGRPGPCVALIKLSLIDLDVRMTEGAMGAVTLLLEVRDSVTNEPLMRYGQRRNLAGQDLETAFRSYSIRFQRDLNRALPSDVPPNVVSCEDRGRPAVAVE